MPIFLEDVSEDLAAMYAEFEKHGPAAIEKVRDENPAPFLNIARGTCDVA